MFFSVKYPWNNNNYITTMSMLTLINFDNKILQV